MSTEREGVLAVIPARGGSKGLPRKNILPLAGKPLIAYSIEAALASRLVTRVVVSTEDEEIAEVARAYGAEVPFLRPKELADDKVSVNAACQHLQRVLSEQGYLPRTIAILYPTHPFRTPGFIDRLTARTLEGYSPVYPAKRLASGSCSYVIKNDTGWTFLNCDKHAYRPYGLFEGIYCGGPSRGSWCEVVDDPAALIDIDELPDFLLAEEVVKRKLFDFGLAS
jgi:hypothetical protein